MEPVAGLQLGYHGVLAHLVGLLAADRLVHRRVEACPDRLHRFDSDRAQRLLKLDDHHAEAVQELLAVAIPGRVIDGAPEVVEDREKGPGRILGRIPGTVGHLLGLASPEVLEVGGQTKELVAPLGKLASQALDLLGPAGVTWAGGSGTFGATAGAWSSTPSVSSPTAGCTCAPARRNAGSPAEARTALPSAFRLGWSLIVGLLAHRPWSTEYPGEGLANPIGDEADPRGHLE